MALSSAVSLLTLRSVENIASQDIPGPLFQSFLTQQNSTPHLCSVSSILVFISFVTIGKWMTMCAPPPTAYCDLSSPSFLVPFHSSIRRTLLTFVVPLLQSGGLCCVFL
eukprot:TRINITY_DN8869_c3_g1_i1.p1 TRINITY_DN8869_c3_g1~~TRINITY_DN8869_c3_g1_i1.p1  ORF type:complete len:109 (+),score=6.34 TRINITY_DN8869_c3_g1_i1:367-693(+)